MSAVAFVSNHGWVSEVWQMHGGDIYHSKVTWDFSVNVNPCGIPREVNEAILQGITQLTCYPDISCSELKQAIEKTLGITAGQVVCGNGASELIAAICRWKKPKRVLLAAPGFSGYTREVEKMGAAITWFFLEEEKNFCPDEKLLQRIWQVKPELVFWASPSNPTGVVLDEAYQLRLARVCEEVRTTLVLDECFAELSEHRNRSFVRRLLREHEHMIILRAFTKSFAIPGLRLGYLLAGREQIAKELERELPEWNVSGLAQRAGVAACGCESFLKESVDFIVKEREFLKNGLTQLGFRVFPSEANYLLFDTGRGDWKEKLLEKEILIRDCRDYPGLREGFYRVAVRTRCENQMLLQAFRNGD